MTSSREIVLALWSCVLSGLATAACAQSAPDDVPRTKPVNLQVLPKELSGAKLGKLMKQYTKDLGVECRHCHAENPQTHKLDYVSDDVPAKQAARVIVHSGFASPASGKFNADLKKEFTERIEQLLAERTGEL